MKVFKTNYKGYNSKGAKIVSRYITENKKIIIDHLKESNGWDIGWSIQNSEGECLAHITSTNIHNICKRYGFVEAF